MPCFDPLFASDDDGLVTIKPDRLSALSTDGQYMELSCGQCASCRANRARDWAIRCVHESQMHTRRVGRGHIQKGCFITLTYNDQELPSDGNLDVSHWQNFAKKLRRDVGPFRFLHCGEYGDRTGRPHYHACLFGIDFTEDRYEWNSSADHHITRSETLEATWGRGFCTIGPLNYATARYTAGYVVKKLRKNQREYFDVQAKPEYITMSRRPGLGKSWFDKYWRDVYPKDQVTLAGKTFRPPKYYDKLLREMDPVFYDEVLMKREEYTSAQGPSTDRQLEARRALWHATPTNNTHRDQV